MLGNGVPTEVGRLRSIARWRETPRWAERMMVAGIAACLSMFIFEYLITQTYAFHLRDLVPMFGFGALAFWLARPATCSTYVGELGVATATSKPLGSSRRVLVFEDATHVEVKQERGQIYDPRPVTFTWYDASGAPVFVHTASAREPAGLGFGYAAIDAFRSYQAQQRELR